MSYLKLCGYVCLVLLRKKDFSTISINCRYVFYLLCQYTYVLSLMIFDLSWYLGGNYYTAQNRFSFHIYWFVQFLHKITQSILLNTLHDNMCNSCGKCLSSVAHLVTYTYNTQYSTVSKKASIPIDNGQCEY